MCEEENQTQLRQVCVIGVSGCSAAGKSCYAHDLAAALHSPLFPVSLDHFFDPDACTALGTFEDCRTVKLDAFCAAVTQLVHVLQTTPCSDWHEAIATRVPVLSGYLVATTPAAPAAEEGEKLAASATSLSSSADASLCAHEAEDLARRAERGLTTHTVHAPQPDAVTYIVCEGFLLFARLDVSVTLFDAMLDVNAPRETACWRRFNRLPRRKQPPPPPAPPHQPSSSLVPSAGRPAGVYEARIRALWHTRTESRRTDLARDLEERVRETARLVQQWGDDGAMTDVTSSVASTMRVWLSPAHFFPPRMETEDACAGTTTPLWDAATGAPTAQFIEVMLGGTDAQPSSTWSSDDSTLSSQEWGQLKAALDHDAAALSTAPSSLACRYAEFRYWFVQEVLYYHTLYQPLQQCHMELCQQHCPATFLAHVVNDTATTREALHEQALEMAAQLTRHFSAQTE